MTSKFLTTVTISSLSSSNGLCLYSILLCFSLSNISLIVSSVQVALGLPTFLLLCTHFLSFPFSRKHYNLMTLLVSQPLLLFSIFILVCFYKRDYSLCLTFLFHHNHLFLSVSMHLCLPYLYIMVSIFNIS